MSLLLRSIDDVHIDYELAPPKLTDLEFQKCYKYADIDYVYERACPYVKYLIDNSIISGGHKNTLVDVKIHFLKKGQYPALKHWHIDGVRYLDNPAAEEKNQLFISTDLCATEFLEKEVKLRKSDVDLDHFLRFKKGVKIPALRWCSYGRLCHRATPAVEDCWRLLVRITETDIIKPVNKEFKVTYK